MDKIEEIISKSRDVSDYAKNYISYLSKLLLKLDLSAVKRVVEVFQNARFNKNTIFFVGNGGSAATCSHFAEDLALCIMKDEEEPFKALSLTDNMAYITALGNDIGYENIFVEQLKRIYKSGDVVVGISASGNSINVIKAIEYANEKGGITIGILGFDGGIMKKICKYYVHLETNKGEYGPVEDSHLILIHIITTYIKLKRLENKKY